MVNRFAGYESIGSVDVGPQDREVLVGSFSMDADDDSIWFRVTQTSPGNVWNYSYGLLTWRTAYGSELGTVKVYGTTQGQVYKLGVGLPPVGKTGEVYFTPRPYNSRWIAADDPQIWSLSFEAQSGQTSAGLPDNVVAGAVLSVDPDFGKYQLDFYVTDQFATLLVNLLPA